MMKTIVLEKEKNYCGTLMPVNAHVYQISGNNVDGFIMTVWRGK